MFAQYVQRQAVLGVTVVGIVTAVAENWSSKTIGLTYVLGVANPSKEECSAKGVVTNFCLGGYRDVNCTHNWNDGTGARGS